MDPRHEKPNCVWNGTGYDVTFKASEALPAQRSVITFVSGAKDTTVVQFVEKDAKIVGSKVIAGSAAPVRGLLDAIGHASTVVINEDFKDALAIPSLSVNKSGVTTVVVNAPDSLVDAASSDAHLSSLHGAYHNVLSARGVSAFWNGFLGKSSSKARELNEVRSIPSVVVKDITALSVEPNNLAHAASIIVFYEKGAAKANISEAEAVKKLVALTDESKAELIASLVKGKKLSVIGADADLAL